MGKGSKSITRQELYNLVWSEPMTKVAERFRVSSSYMARICTQMNVPRPQRGYWAKLTAGKKVKQLPLPPSQPGKPLKWTKGNDFSNYHRPLPKAPSPSQRKKRIVMPKSEEHILLTGARNHFSAGRLSHEGAYLIPAKKLLIDLVISKSGLDPALAFAEKFFSILEAQGYRVVIAPHGEQFHRLSVQSTEIPKHAHYFNNLWSPLRCTVVYIGSVAIGLTIIETAEEVEVGHVNGKHVRLDLIKKTKANSYSTGFDWTTHKIFPTGKLCLQAYSPYPRAKWSHKWHEKKRGELNSQINTIIKELENATVRIAKLVEEGERQAKIERKEHDIQMEKWRIEGEKRRKAKALEVSKSDLYTIINNWAEANKIENFFNDVANRAESLSPSAKQKMAERLKIARQLVGSIDALEHFLGWKTPDEQ